MNPVLTICRGLPASGKTTWARAWLDMVADQGRRGLVMRVNRDDLRAMLLDNRYRIPEGAIEDRVTSAQTALVRGLLGRGINVVIDDTNLHPDHVVALQQLAQSVGAEWVIRDFTEVPVTTCVARDAERPRPVGEQVIRDMWQRHLAPHPKEAPA